MLRKFIFAKQYAQILFVCLALTLLVSAQDQAALRDRTVSLIKTEELILDLSPRHARLVAWLESAPKSTSAPLPVDLATITLGTFMKKEPLEELMEPLSPSSLDGLQKGNLSLHSSPKSFKEGANPFQHLIPRIQTWQFSGLGIVAGNLVAEDQLQLETKLEASGKLRGGEQFGIKAQQQLIWIKKEGQWTLSEWHQKDLTLLTSRVSLFEDVSVKAMPEERIRTAAQRFTKRLMVEKALQSGSFPVPNQNVVPFIQADNAYNYPSVAVVDYDNDGWDDLYLTSDWDPTQMLRNLGNGQFEDTTAATGLGLRHSANCAVFADFDNDGDQDAFIGGGLSPSGYYENRDGHFYNVTEQKSNLGALFFVSAVSVTDVNRDGLLDIYASTYGPVPDMDPPWEESMLPKREWEIMKTKRKNEHRWLDLTGQSNVLLLNRGKGNFERHPYDEHLSQWRRSFQAVWADYDEDGDDDLYICNDFAPDELLRNDTPAGALSPVFTEVTKSVFANGALGFGMGASWGDFDSDGDLDLYVSNMYSKAGKRIISQMNAVDPRVSAAAQGNFLFEWKNDRFKQRAGDEKDQIHVHRVGWSYGGQFGDLNNDGFADLYVPSGYYTAPPSHSTLVDT